MNNDGFAAFLSRYIFSSRNPQLFLVRKTKIGIWRCGHCSLRSKLRLTMLTTFWCLHKGYPPA